MTTIDIDTLPVRLVCATRQPKERFLTHTSTGISANAFYGVSKIELCLFAENSLGLSQIYNKAIEDSIQKPAILVFAHDDILISDFFWADRIRDGLKKFDIIGLAGNTRRAPNQPAWAFINDRFEWDDAANLSGTVGHGKQVFPVNVKPFGPSLKECKLLDGLLLAAYSTTLISSGLRFDEAFKFHFYDMDFCRTAETLNLKMGTIPLSVVHESGGNFGNEQWKDNLSTYIKKWEN